MTTISKKVIIPGAIVVAALLGAAGSSALSLLTVNAATDSGTQSTITTTADSQQTKDPSQGGHVGTNGTKEELLTGATAEKVKAAALAKVPGGTIQRVENDAEGSPYEAHMLQADGTPVTVKVDASFNATSAETGGPGEHGGRGPSTSTQSN